MYSANANIDLINTGEAKPTDFFEIEKTLSKLSGKYKIYSNKNFEVKAFEDDTKVSIKVDILSSKNLTILKFIYIPSLAYL